MLRLNSMDSDYSCNLNRVLRSNETRFEHFEHAW